MPVCLRLVGILLLTGLMIGCGDPPPTVVEPAFSHAIAVYLQANNMAMKLKDLKQGPVIDGNLATLSASLSHEQLGGPSVTWQFQFDKQADGTWRVTSHSDR